ncbi:MAG: RrF2 family transcriptional regulator [Acidimicrobiia bacterium]
MKLSDGVEWGVHVTTLLAALPPDGALPAARLAEYHGVPAAYLAKHLQALSRAGILESVRGPRGGYRLARPAAEITLLEVVEAIDGAESAFVCTEIRQRGPVACAPEEYRVPCGIQRAMSRADRAWRAELRSVSVADLIAGVLRDAPPDQLAAGARWIQEALT